MPTYEELNNLIKNFTEFNLKNIFILFILIIFLIYKIIKNIFNDMYNQKIKTAEIQLYKVYKPLYEIFILNKSKSTKNI